MENERMSRFAEKIASYQAEEIMQILKSAPPVLSERTQKWSNYNRKYIFVSYSHLDFRYVYSDLKKLWVLNANYWYDKELERETYGETWKERCQNNIMNKNCAGVLFYVSKNSFLSGAVYEEIKLCLSRISIDQDFSYRIVLLEGNNIFDIQNQCELDYTFTSERLINIHKLWGDEHLFLEYSSAGNHLLSLADWFVKSNCINDIDYDEKEIVTVKKDYIIVGNTLISYFGEGDNFIIDDEDIPHIKTIASNAIASPTLKIIRIPEGIEEIEDFSIIACTHLERVYLPKSIKRLSYYALSNFHMQSISIDGDNNYYSIDENGFIYSMEGNVHFTLFASPNKNKVKELIIKPTVVCINDFAISCCDYLENIVFSKNLKRIGYWSVKECKNLKTITLYPGIEYISPHAFDCTYIEKVIFRGSKEEWDEYPMVNKECSLKEYFSNVEIVFDDQK